MSAVRFAAAFAIVAGSAGLPGMPVEGAQALAVRELAIALQRGGYVLVMPVTELGDGGQSMQAVAEAQAEWLRARVVQSPRSGNTILVTHSPNLARAFPDWGTAVADGETVVLRPDGGGAMTVVGRIRLEDWTQGLPKTGQK